MNLKAALALVNQAQRDVAAGNFAAAERAMKPLLQQAIIAGDTDLATIFSIAIMDCRRHHVLEVTIIRKRIDPIQSVRREQS